jgi:hypothetical protein
VESHNQQGGITAHNVNIGTQVNVTHQKPIYRKKKVLIPTAIFLVAAIVAIISDSLGVFERFFKKEGSIMPNQEHSQPIHNITSYNQSGGITAHTVNVNQQRTILSQAQVKKEKRGDIFILQVILSQTSGVWDPSTMFGIQVKTSGPYKAANIVRGLPSAQFDVRTAENKEDGFFAYSTRTAPIKDEPIVLEIQSATEIDLTELGVEPLAKSE